MKFGILAAGLCAALFMTACDTTEKQNTSAGAVSGKSACCADSKTADAKCSGDAKACTKTDCAQKEVAAKTVAPGAVSGEKKDGGCCQMKASCPATGASCPATGTTTKG
jgi:hypothetical protein